MAYPPLPLCKPQETGESRPEYAARVLRFLLSTGTTATLTDEQLQQADMAAQRAVSQVRALDGRASVLEIPDHAVLDTLSAARHTIAGVLAWRRETARQEAQAVPGGTNAPTGGRQPGRPAPLSPPPPSLPPTGGLVRPELIPVPARSSNRDDVRF